MKAIESVQQLDRDGIPEASVRDLQSVHESGRISIKPEVDQSRVDEELAVVNDVLTYESQIF